MSIKEENIQGFAEITKKGNHSPAQTQSKLSQRETEVLRLIAAGHSNKEIAESLQISQRTVDGHKSNMLIKTGSKNIVVLLKWALNNKLITF